MPMFRAIVTVNLLVCLATTCAAFRIEHNGRTVLDLPPPAPPAIAYCRSSATKRRRHLEAIQAPSPTPRCTARHPRSAFRQPPQSILLRQRTPGEGPRPHPRRESRQAMPSTSTATRPSLLFSRCTAGIGRRERASGQDGSTLRGRAGSTSSSKTASVARSRRRGGA